MPQGYATLRESAQLRVDDGSLAQSVSGGVDIGLDICEPVPAFDDTLVDTMNNAGTMTEVITFTSAVTC